MMMVMGMPGLLLSYSSVQPGLRQKNVVMAASHDEVVAAPMLYSIAPSDNDPRSMSPG